MTACVHGLYAITPELVDTAVLLTRVRAALTGGAGAVQYRQKHADAALRVVQAGALVALCKAQRVPLIINDDVALALRVNADGVHLGRDDGSVAEARSALGADAIIGVSCYNEMALADAAAAAGANYAAFGSIFASNTKPGAVRASVALLAEAKHRLNIPIVAIGGVTLGNAQQLIDVDVDAVAVISDLFAAPDITARAAMFHQLFENHVRKKPATV